MASVVPFLPFLTAPPTHTLLSLRARMPPSEPLRSGAGKLGTACQCPPYQCTRPPGNRPIPSTPLPITAQMFRPDTALAATIEPVPGTSVRFQPWLPAWNEANGMIPVLVTVAPNAQTVSFPAASDARTTDLLKGSRPALQVPPRPCSHPPGPLKAHTFDGPGAAVVSRNGSWPSADTTEAGR